MALRIGDEVPDFTAETTQGPIRFHDWIGNSWAFLMKVAKLFDMIHPNASGNAASRSASVKDEEAQQKYPQGFKTLKPYLRTVQQPK